MRKVGRAQNSAIALFLVITSLIIISLAMRELLVRSTAQVDRVRNSYDRLQAFYLARSNIALTRAFLEALRIKLPQDQKFDTLKNIPQPVPFPVMPEMTAALAGLGAANQEESASPQSAPLAPEKLKGCQDFNKDFPGESYALIDDLSARFNVNIFSLSRPPNSTPNQDPRLPYLSVFANLLSPNFKFSDQLQQRGIDRDEVVRQVRDAIDRNDQDDSNGGSELLPYQSAELDYGPAQRPLVVIDELKLIPSIDDFLFAHLKDKVTALPATREAKINLNNVTADVFQALFRNRSGNDDELARQFIQDRTENNRVYDENFKNQLEEAGFPPDSLYEELLGTQTEAFLVTARATVGETEVAIEATVRNPRFKDSNNRSSTAQKSVIIQRVLP